MDSSGIPKKRSKKELFTKGSLIAVIISIPSLVTFFLAWFFLHNLIEAAIIGMVVHFIAMGFVVKNAKKILGTKY